MITLAPDGPPISTPFGPVDNVRVGLVSLWVIAAAATRPVPICPAARRLWNARGDATVTRDGVMHTPVGDYELHPVEWSDGAPDPIYLAVRR